MIWIFRLLLLSLSGAAVATLMRRRRRPVYPAPESLIIHLPDDVPDRFLPLEGGVNFRDVGGYKTADGKRVRRGLVYRSGALGSLTEADVMHLAKLGVKLVCDLRGEDERVADPDRLPTEPAPEYLHLPLTVEDDRRRRLRALLINPALLGDMMTEMYTRTMIDRNAKLYGGILRRLADPANLPTVIHCTAGKDRTGMAVALLLLALGVPEDIIIADYSLSNLYFKHFREYGAKAISSVRWMGLGVEDMQPLLVANPDTLRAALAHLREQYGSVESYLLLMAGLDEETLAALRANLLE